MHTKGSRNMGKIEEIRAQMSGIHPTLFKNANL